MVTKSQVVSSNKYLDENQKKIQAEYIAQVLSTYGFTLNAIAGTLGNMEQECSLNPGLWQSQNEGNYRGGFGLTQWTPATHLTDWCENNGYDFRDIDSQLARFKYEFENGGQYYATKSYNLSFKEFSKSTKDVEWLAAAFCYNYERPGDVHLSNRKKYAKKWFEFLKDKSLTFESRTTGVDSSDANVKKYYTTVQAGGLNPCILGKNSSGRPLWAGSVLPNCVGYAWGRAYELMGKRPQLSLNNAGKWFKENKENGIYKYSTDKTKPELGAIMCWSDSEQNTGHVAVVEKIEGTKITTSNYGWGYDSFYQKVFDTSKPAEFNYKSNRIFRGYIYLTTVNLSTTGTTSTVQNCTSFIEKLTKIAEAEVGYCASSGKKCKYYEQIDAMHKKLDSSYQKLYWGAKNGADWCAGFVDWCFFRALGAIDENGGNPENYEELVDQMKSITNHGAGGASCGYNISYYKEKGTYFNRGDKTPQAGDEIFLYNKCHTGLVVKVEGSTVYTVEGNTGGGNGRVKKKSYSLSSGDINGYGRPNWEEAPMMDPSQEIPQINNVRQYTVINPQGEHEDQDGQKGKGDNDHFLNISVYGGGIPSLTRGGTITIKWFRSDLLESQFEDPYITEVVHYMDIPHNAKDTNFNITVYQFTEDLNQQNAVIDASRVEGREFYDSKGVRITDSSFINMYLRICDKVDVTNTQINLNPEFSQEYKDSTTSNVLQAENSPNNNNTYIIKGRWDNTQQKIVAPTTFDGKISTSITYGQQIDISLPVVNIYINNKFRQCIPYIYVKEWDGTNKQFKYSWKMAIPYIYDSKISEGNSGWLDTRTACYDSQSVSQQENGDYWNGTEWK